MSIHKIKTISNPIYFELKSLNLISDDSVVEISDKTRDSKVSVFQDKKTKIIFLESYLTSSDYYSNIVYNEESLEEKTKSEYANKKASTRDKKTLTLEDDLRRVKQFQSNFKEKNILDFGCGWGSFLENISVSELLCGIELRQECIDYICKHLPRIQVENNINQFTNNFDIITLFHVLEHIPYQVETLKRLKNKLNEKGKMIIEVPHAEDFLIGVSGIKEFKNFTFWKEHLILHTVTSLKSVLREAGFKKIKINYFQRYGLDNHLGWFLKKKPGGHNFYKDYSSHKLNIAYCDNLVKLKKTDTLIAIAEN